jgi:ABC-type antimicrobial peptide transport system permease subunit
MGKGSPLGKDLMYGDKPFRVVGVVKDYVYGDMYGRPDPVVFFSSPADARYLYVRLRTGVKAEEALAKIGTVMKRDNPFYPFSSTFVDDQFNAVFTAEALIGKLSRVFSVLAVFISCLGLFGLSSFTAERRTKEIGIRKVLGASVTGITSSLSWDFLKLVLFSNLIAFPLAWGLMNHWLAGYAYRITISWWIFPAAGVLSMLIALATVSFQSVRAGLSNPVRSLRAE